MTHLFDAVWVRCFLLAALSTGLVLQASAGDGTFEPKVRPELNIPRTNGSIEIDGRLDDAGWEGAAHTTGFAEVQPDDRAEPLKPTEVLITYDAGHLYVAFTAHDDPGDLRASLQNRDAMFQDDWVGVVLDTYGDAARAYELFVNPLGVQGDGLMTPQGEDMGFDVVYESAGRLTAEGYQVEMAIPFRSLRFPAASVQDWRVTFIRNHPRASRHVYSWAAMSRDNPCLMCQLGTLRGIHNIRAGGGLDVIPALVGKQSGRRAVPEDPASSFENGRASVSPSLNLRYDLSSSLAAEATINPDFSQVASDAARIDVNTTFALSFPERRPFFQEGSELLDTRIDAVYTRAINDPIAATKATRRGPTSAVYLGAVDESTPLLLPFQEHSAVVEAGRSVSNILRVHRSLGDDSFVGGLLSDRRLAAGGSGTEAGLDAAYRFHKNYRAEGQLLLSRTAEPSSNSFSEQVRQHQFAGGAHTADLDGEKYWGYGAYAGLSRDARYWNANVTYLAHSPTFRTANGFVRRNDFHRIATEQRLNIRPDTRFVDGVFPGFSARREIDYSGTVREDVLQPEVFVQLTGQTDIFARYRLRSERFRGISFDGLRDWHLNLNTNFSEVLSGGGYLAGGAEIYRTDAPQVGRAFNYGLSATLRPLSRLFVKSSFDYARLTNPENGEAFFSGYIARSHVGLQFTRELSVRLIAQYDEFNDRFDVEPLLAYRLNPYSVFYLGSRLDYGAYEAPYGLTPTERQFFFKFQYLFQR